MSETTTHACMHACTRVRVRARAHAHTHTELLTHTMSVIHNLFMVLKIILVNIYLFIYNGNNAGGT